MRPARLLVGLSHPFDSIIGAAQLLYWIGSPQISLHWTHRVRHKHLVVTPPGWTPIAEYTISYNADLKIIVGLQSFWKSAHCQWQGEAVWLREIIICLEQIILCYRFQNFHNPLSLLPDIEITAFYIYNIKLVTRHLASYGKPWSIYHGGGGTTRGWWACAPESVA